MSQVKVRHEPTDDAWYVSTAGTGLQRYGGIFLSPNYKRRDWGKDYAVHRLSHALEAVPAVQRFRKFRHAKKAVVKWCSQ